MSSFQGKTSVLTGLLLFCSCSGTYSPNFPFGFFLLQSPGDSSASGSGASNATVDDYSSLVLAETSLLGYWRLNESGVPFVDSKNGNDGSIAGAGTVYGSQTGATSANDADNCLVLNNGGTYRVIVPYNAVLTVPGGSSITIESWIQPTRLPEKMDLLTLGRVDGATEDSNYAIRINGAKVGFFFGDASHATNNAVYRTSDYILRKDEWWHLAVTHTYGSIADTKIYVNGIERTGAWIVGAGTETPDTPAKDLWIGASDGSAAGTPDNVFEGCVDEVAVYGSVLSATTIKTHYRTAYNKIVKLSAPQTRLGINDTVSIETLGGTTPYSFAVSAGAGTVDSIGNFTAPAAMGSSTVQVTDAEGFTDSITIKSYVQPDDVAGLLAWYKADAQSYAADALIPIVSDSSGNGNLASQGTVGRQPLFREGRAHGLPAFEFDGGNDEMMLPITLDPLGLVLSTISILQSNATPGIILGQTPGGNAMLIHHNSCFGSDIIMGNVCPSAASYTPGTPVMHSAVTDAGATTASYWFDGSAVTTGGGLAYASSIGNWYLGSINGSVYFDGLIAELLIYNASLATADREALECYLAEKYDPDLVPSLTGHGCP